VTSNFEIRDNATLARIDGMTSLTTVGGTLDIANNPMLPQCEADAMAAQVGNPCSCSANDGTGGC
jgi:hypothetical protein